MIQSLCKEKNLIPSGESKLKDKYRYWKIAIKLKMLKEKNFAKERHRVLSLHTQQSSTYISLKRTLTHVIATRFKELINQPIYFTTHRIQFSPPAIAQTN